ncbi:PREDICTED: RING1 and YY1-binding protein A-like [Amphimedon queenslandica]|uniref:RanBP2-type domain-containing protein n=1 Tax=Amphimedon queenslandica TaxID=400682 RepID=A0A1X7V7X2_AMPQE|nr:PREDICTED: RING1 and YY1-binding protein A-like [Amphimedon queenslandica]|eukprot:XP_011402961.1 PREDICTED: RING1 and YY1-binding protein A-like [Amphimedon queenslandica]
MDHIIEWQCPVCTLLNKASAFKCRMCGTAKGTSTRQSKHTVTFQQQFLAETLHKGARSYTRSSSLPGCSNTVASTSKRKLKGKASNKRNSTHRSWPTLNDIDRSTGKSYSVTVGSVTVVITEYRQLTSNR